MSTITASIATHQGRIIAVAIAAAVLFVGLTAVTFTSDFSVTKAHYKAHYVARAHY